MTGPAPEPLFVAGHLALDLVNTTLAPDGVELELIGDGASFLAWLVDAGVLDAPGAARYKRRLGAKELDDLAAEARKLRAWATAWLARWRLDPAAAYEPERRRLNDLLARARTYPQLVSRDGRLALVDHRRDDAADELLAALARALADLLVHEQPELVKRCASSHCTLWFLDRTKAHRRLYCSPTACGNREKVAAFRARQRRPE